MGSKENAEQFPFGRPEVLAERCRRNIEGFPDLLAGCITGPLVIAGFEGGLEDRQLLVSEVLIECLIELLRSQKRGDLLFLCLVEREIASG